MNCRKVSAQTDLGRRGAGHPVSLLPPPREALGDLVALRHLHHHVPRYLLRPDQGKVTSITEVALPLYYYMRIMCVSSHHPSTIGLA